MREIGNRFAESIVLNNIANILWAQGDLETAQTMYAQVTTITQELGDKSGYAGAAINMSHIHLQQGHLKSADEQIERGNSMVRAIGERAILAEGLNTAGEIRLEQANFPEARARFQEALKLRQDLGDELGINESRQSLAQLHMAESQHAEAEKLLTAARDAFHKAQSQDQEVAAVADLTRALVNQGKSAQALKAIEGTRTLAKSTENPYVKSVFLIEAARAHAFSGNAASARAELANALQLASEHGFALLELRARLANAEIEQKHGDAAKAVTDIASIRSDALARGLPLIAREAESLVK